MTSADQTKSRMGYAVGADPGAALGSAYLMVLEGDTSSIFHLPGGGTIVIGRGEVELRLTHASVSRRHATLRIDDGVVRIADLGSHNGTRVNGEPVTEFVRVASGDVVTVGDVVMIVHFTAPPSHARADYAETAWRGRLAEELDRATTFQRSLGVVAVFATPAQLVELGAALRRIDVLGHADDGHGLLLLPEVDRATARELLARALAVVPRARAGLAMCPDDACDADTLMMMARQAARRALPGAVAEVEEVVTDIDLGGRRVLVADPAMARVFAQLERLAVSELPVLITGETGVGKENAAYATHHWSKRSGAFVAINCAAIGPETLVESELFGHEKGAFTGAVAAKLGLFEQADGGTVFLDEVGELPLAIQAKLLRVLETRKLVRLGDTRERSVDVRLVAATNRSLDEEVAAGRFRQDLYFRIGGAVVIVPPLRDRQCEIPLLARRFLADACARAGRSPLTITTGAMQRLLTYAWPGNVRELRNAIDYVAATAPDAFVEASDLPARLGGTDDAPAPAAAPAPAPAPAVPAAAPAPATFRPINEELRELEQRRMSEALAACDGVRVRAAQLIDMPIRTFTLKVKQYGL